MAGVEGLEPPHARIKTLCLTNLATPQFETLADDPKLPYRDQLKTFFII